MIDDDKFYFISPVSELSSTRKQPMVTRWNPDFYIEVDEAVDTYQYITVAINKLKQKDREKPKSTKFEKVRPVIKEIFLSHYNLAIKYISENEINEGEFYLHQHSKDWFQVAWFSEDPKSRQHIEIDFRDAVEDLWMTLRCSGEFKFRKSFRKDAVPITRVRFLQFLNLTLQFLIDSDSYLIFLSDYLLNFYQLGRGESKIEGFIITADKVFEKVLHQLELRKENISKRLIENDTDSEKVRFRLRGELDGIEYSIKTMLSNK